MRLYCIPLLRYDLRMGKPLRYHLDTSSSVAKEEEKGEHLESVEHLEQIEPPPAPNLSNDKEDLCTQGRNSRNYFPEDPSKHASRLPEMEKHSSRGLSNSKEERVEGIGWTSQ
jgi:hypothetical protein